MQNKNG